MSFSIAVYVGSHDYSIATFAKNILIEINIIQ